MAGTRQAVSLIALLKGALGYDGLSWRARASLRRELLSYPLLTIIHGLTAGGFAAVLAHKSMGANETQQALLVAAPMAALLFALLFSTNNHDSAKKLVFWPAVGIVLMTAAIGGVSDPWSLLGVVLIIHCLWGSVTVNRAHIWRQNYTPAERGQAVARILTLGFLVAAVAGFIASRCFDWTAQKFNFHGAYRFVYPAAAAVAALGLIPLYRLRVRRHVSDYAVAAPPRRFNLLDTLHVLTENAVFRKYTIFQIAQGFGNMMCTVIEVQFLTMILKVSYIEAALVLVVLPTFGRLVSVYFWARLNDRVHALRMRSFTAVAWLICRLIFLVALFTRSMPVLLVMATMKGLTIGGSALSWNLAVGYLAPRKDVGRYMSLHVFFTGVRGMIAPLLGAYLFNHVMGPYAAVLGVCILAAGTAGFLWLGFAHGKHGPRDGVVVQPRKT